MNRLLAKVSAYVSVFVIGSIPLGASAQLDAAQDRLDVAGAELPGGSGEASLPQLVGSFINVFIGLLGIIFVVEVVYAGYLYLTAAGETDKVEKAKNMLRQGVIGMILVVAAYVIAGFVVDVLVESIGSGGGGTSNGS